jgi:hypothetical protein
VYGNFWTLLHFKPTMNICLSLCEIVIGDESNVCDGDSKQEDKVRE